ncbi:MAG: protein translocase subunit SecD, partial [Myxococcales bacterium]|nr:protein translocase subunit SecD [Myxococcales bacterium]
DADSEAVDELLSLYPMERTDVSASTIRLEVTEDYVSQTRDSSIDTAIARIRQRVDSLGVAEPNIQRQGESDIVVQLPGLGEDAFEEAKRLIGTTAQLEFRGLHPQNGTYWTRVQGLIPRDTTIEFSGGGIWAEDLEELRAFAQTLEANTSSATAVPDGAEIVFSEDIEFHPTSGEVLSTRYQMTLVSDRVEMTGETIADSRPSNDPNTNQPVVSLTFDREGAERFCEVSTAYVNEQLAIVLDDILKSAPVIQNRICNGRAQITMGNRGAYNALLAEVQELVNLLRHGALPAPIEPQFETQVGPSLGAESVAKGTLAMAIGSILVIAFMLVYYRGAGLIANVALVLNILFILALLAAVKATVTLPGIAGIILTIGMAVDANVIIFERIREELRLGKTARDAVAAGYSKALSAVLDANITTGIAGMVLAQYGTGPVQGFAVTLIFGIISSVFTALVVTRLLFDLVLTRSKTQRLSI